jgi:signal transduction histidine kinase
MRKRVALRRSRDLVCGGKEHVPDGGQRSALNPAIPTLCAITAFGMKPAAAGAESFRAPIPMSRLAAFIRDNTEHILSEWETFARSLPEGGSMGTAALRDHAAAMLEGITRDLETPQRPGEHAQEAKGKTDAGDDASAAARGHGAGRAERGFTIAEMVAEFRALRATVIRLWTEQQGEIAGADLDDASRFHAAMDQAIAESITRYTRELNRSKDRFLAILGHDLRTPLNAITMSANFVLETGERGEPTIRLMKTIVSSAKRMNQMVGDLLDFARGQFGQGMPITRGETDARKVVDEVVAEVAASNPTARVHIEASGDLHGQWDSTRLAQALTNLIANAVQHGSSEAPVKVAAHGTRREVVISIHNRGPVIPAEQLNRIFGGTGRDSAERAGGGHLGLGLYIVHEIVKAHGGTVDAISSAEGTTFTIHLPRHP